MHLVASSAIRARALSQRSANSDLSQERQRARCLTPYRGIAFCIRRHVEPDRTGIRGAAYRPAGASLSGTALAGSFDAL